MAMYDWMSLLSNLLQIYLASSQVVGKIQVYKPGYNFGINIVKIPIINL